MLLMNMLHLTAAIRKAFHLLLSLGSWGFLPADQRVGNGIKGQLFIDFQSVARQLPNS